MLHFGRKLEQLECLHSEHTPCRPMITKTIDSYQIPFNPSQLDQPLLRYSRPKSLMRSLCAYLTNAICDTPSPQELFPSQKWNDCGQYLGSYRGDINPSTGRRTGRQTDRQTDKVKPIYHLTPNNYNVVCWGIIIPLNLLRVGIFPRWWATFPLPTHRIITRPRFTER